MKDAKCVYSHPFLMFWVGLLTGAVVVGFLFLSGVLSSGDYQSAILKMKAVQTQIAPVGGIVSPIGGDGL